MTYKAGSAYLGQGFRIKKLFDDHVGILRAIDPKTGKIAWEHKEKFPLWAGTLTTAGGLSFYSGTHDYYLRAFDTTTGQELWKGRLPVGSQATPMSFVSPKTQQQYVVVTAGGSRQSPDRGDYVVAYRLKGQ